MLSGSNHKVRTDDDLVFYNDAASSDGAVLWAGQPDRPQTVTIVPDRVDSDVDWVVVGAAGGLLDVRAPALLTVTVANANGQSVGVATFQADAPLTAMLLVEVYRRAGPWRIQLLAQGYAGGRAIVKTCGSVCSGDVLIGG